MSKTPYMVGPEPGDLDDEGFLVGIMFERIGICSECGLEATQEQVCLEGTLEPIT